MSRQGRDETGERHSSPDSDTARGSGSTGAPRKRPSRAGTRSVSTLSATQLERKRANDREAQRAIRQRTKEHIEKLERTIAELSASEDPSDQLVTTLKRNKELEEENTILRMKLEQANYQLGVSEGSGRSSSWDDTVASRHQPPGQGVPIIGQAQSASLIASARTSSPRPNPFAMGQNSQWPQSNPYPGGSSVKPDSSGGDIHSEEYASWSSRRYGDTASPRTVQQSSYAHVYGAPSQASAQRTTSPLSYQPVQEGHPQSMQPAPVVGSNVPMAEYHGTGQAYMSHQHPHQQLPPPQHQQQEQYREQAQSGQAQQRDHPHHQIYYGGYSQG